MESKRGESETNGHRRSTAFDDVRRRRRFSPRRGPLKKPHRRRAVDGVLLEILGHVDGLDGGLALLHLLFLFFAVVRGEREEEEREGKKEEKMEKKE